MDRLSYLLQRYTNKTATQAEMKELSALMDKNFEDSMNDTPGLSAQQEERIKMRYQHIVASPRRESVKTVRFKSSWPWMAVAAAITLIIVSLVVLMRDEAGVDQPLQELTATNIVHSGKQYLQLPDGSTVLLNENSELTLDNSFGKSNREVSLKGEGYFDIAHDPDKPFVVHTGKISTKVLGTAFNINAFKPEAIMVTVTRGKVAVGDERHTYGTIIPNEQITVNSANNEFVKSYVDSTQVIAWKENYFILDNVTFEEAAMALEKRFNVKVEIKNDALKKCYIYAWFLNNETLSQVVDDITSLKHATAKMDGAKIIIEGGMGCEDD